MIHSFKHSKNSLSFALLISLSACATSTPREKTLLAMGSGAVIGGIVGGLAAPSDESAITHAAMWAGIGAAVTGVAGLFYFNQDDEMKEKDLQIRLLQKEVSTIKGDGYLESGTRQILGFESNKENNLPPEYRRLVKPGKTSVFKLDQWVSGGENEVIHQDKMIKLEPAQINVGAN